MGDFVDTTRASERSVLSPAFRAVRISSARVNFGFDDAGSHCIHANAFTGDLSGEPDRPRVDGTLRRRVVDVFARAAEACGGGFSNFLL